MIIITAVGEDRPGMAHALARELADLGCNIEDTTMTRLSGEFAMIVVVSPPQELTLLALSARLAPLEASHGLFINCKSIEEHHVAPPTDLARWVLSVYGPEKSGLVAHMTGVLAGLGVNITDVQARVASGGLLYVMVFELEAPAALDAEHFAASLNASAREIGVEASLRPLEEDVL